MEDFLAAGAKAVEDGVNSLTLTVDGDAVPNLFDHRYRTPLFHFTGDISLKQSVDGCITGEATPNFQSSSTYNLTVRR